MKAKMKYSILMLGLALLAQAVLFGQSREIVIEGHDDMKYSVTEIKAKPGEKLKITLKSISKMPADAMSHNFVLLDKGTDAGAFINDGMSYKDNEYISPNWEDVVLAKTAMLPGGKAETINITTPSEKGRYTYVCTFPGHFQAGMKGVLIVE